MFGICLWFKLHTVPVICPSKDNITNNEINNNEKNNKR